MREFHHFKLQHQEKALVVHLADTKLFDSLALNELRDELVEVIDHLQPMRMLINFGAVSHCSSEVINILLRVKEKMDSYGGQLRFCGMSKSLREVYKILKLDGRVFQILETAQDAMESFK